MNERLFLNEVHCGGCVVSRRYFNAVVTVRTRGAKGTSAPNEPWEYLAVAGPSTTNLLRQVIRHAKGTLGPFGRGHLYWNSP